MDRKKVIKAIENCICQPKCKDCPWEDCEVEHEVVNCVPYGLMRDTLALLKEQEAVEPKKVKGYKPPIYTLYEYECEECKSPMIYKQPYCAGCGKSVKWE